MTRRIRVDGPFKSINESVKTSFGLRTRRPFWLEDDEGVIQPLSRDMPPGQYSLNLDPGMSLNIPHSDLDLSHSLLLSSIVNLKQIPVSFHIVKYASQTSSASSLPKGSWTKLSVIHLVLVSISPCSRGSSLPETCIYSGFHSFPVRFATVLFPLVWETQLVQLSKHKFWHKPVGHCCVSFFCSHLFSPFSVHSNCFVSLLMPLNSFIRRVFFPPFGEVFSATDCFPGSHRSLDWESLCNPVNQTSLALLCRFWALLAEFLNQFLSSSLDQVAQ